MNRRVYLYGIGILPAAIAAALAMANNAGRAHHADTAPTTEPTSKPTANTVDHYPCPPAPNLSAQEELKTFALPPGYRIELVASEPQVQDPVAISFDSDGRMWVAEMRGYMPDVYAHKEDEPIGRISVLEETQRDGHFDKATVYLDHLYLPRAVSPVADGVLVASPPHLWFCRDTKGDLQCDQKTEVYGKYGAGHDPEYGDNGLLWARDNWIYSATSKLRFRYQGDGKFEEAPTGNRGQWGISQDDVGRLFFNYNSDQLRADLIPTEYLSRNSHYKAAGGNVRVESDQRTWSSRPNPGINRGYEPGNLRDGRLATVTATCGPVIFRGAALGEDAYGNAFIPEPAGNLVMRKLLTEADGAITCNGVYYAPHKNLPQLDFLTSTDERFRPVNAQTGPDGALYIVDMYRGVIQHKTYVTPYLRHQVYERDLEQPLHEGRIWRIVKDGAQLTPLPQMSKETAEQLIQHLSHPNGWWRDTAQRLLVERNDVQSVPLLEQTVRIAPDPLARLHALWALSGMGKLNEETLYAGLANKDPRVCSAAIRLSEPLMADDPKMLAAVLKLENRLDVRLQFVLSVSAIKNAKVEDALVAVLCDSAEKPYIVDAALSGMFGRELQFLQMLLVDPGWEKETPGRRMVLKSLASAAFRSKDEQTASHLFDLAANTHTVFAWQRVSILGGITLVNKGQAKPPKVTLKKVPMGLLELTEDKDPLIADLARQAEAFVRYPGQPRLEPEAIALNAEQKESFARGKELFNAVCAQCHQTDGNGFEGKAPSLRDSPIALGPDIRLIRIVLNGAKGEWHVTGWSPNLEMPTLAVLEDAQIADILTYLRHAWDHNASAVNGATVARVRAELGNRQAAWTEPELLAIPAPLPPTTRVSSELAPLRHGDTEARSTPAH